MATTASASRMGVAAAGDQGPHSSKSQADDEVKNDKSKHTPTPAVVYDSIDQNSAATSRRTLRRYSTRRWR